MAVEDYDIETITTFTKDQAKVTASRYLSAPQGSCHDLCKFGIQNATTEAKPWKRAKKRVTVSTGGIKNKVQEENITSLAWTKKSGINSKPSTTSKFGSSNTLADIKEVINEETVNSKKNSRPSAETNVSTKEHNNNDLRKSQSIQRKIQQLKKQMFPPRGTRRRSRITVIKDFPPRSRLTPI
ncbi:hypothetical protein AAHE18_01G259500 [Arachis hypogaea]